jgi:microcompartment protein CcmL/EutN
MMKTYPAIAILEFEHIATGIYVTDAMVKQSPISILKAGTVHNGKFLIMVGGSVASVDEAYQKGRSLYPDELLDHVILPDVHPELHDGILGKNGQARPEAIGIIETRTVSCAVQSTDRALKETDVDLVVIRLADDLGGKAFSIFTGDLHEVEAAVEAARNNATHPEFWIKDMIIPIIHDEVARHLNLSTYFHGSEPLALKDGEI